jgi:septal ring factor EnvC (AmiA/AmiB activator)
MIRKTFKMLLIGSAVLGGAGFLFLGTDFPSYVGSVASSVRESVTEQIPVEIELKRADNLIRQISPQINKCKLDLARAEVDLSSLQDSIQHLEKVVTAEEKKLKLGAALLREDAPNGVRLAADFGARRRVSADLGRTKDSYVNNRAILKTKLKLVARQTRAVEAAKERLNAVRYERVALEDQVRALKTQQMQVEAMAAASDRFDLDSTALSQAKEVIIGVRKRLDVAQRMLENDIAFTGEPVEGIENRNVIKEIDELFAPDTRSTAVRIELPATR